MWRDFLRQQNQYHSHQIADMNIIQIATYLSCLGGTPAARREEYEWTA